MKIKTTMIETLYYEIRRIDHSANVEIEYLQCESLEEAREEKKALEKSYPQYRFVIYKFMKEKVE